MLGWVAMIVICICLSIEQSAEGSKTRELT